MYKIEKATMADFRDLVNIATESGKPDFQLLNGAYLSRLIVDGRLIAVAGYKDMELDDSGTEWRVLACLFHRGLNKYSKTVVEAGREYLKSIEGKPILALAVKDNYTFNRFLLFMGFKHTKDIAEMKDSGTIYNIYVKE